MTWCSSSLRSSGLPVPSAVGSFVAALSALERRLATLENALVAAEGRERQRDDHVAWLSGEHVRLRLRVRVLQGEVQPLISHYRTIPVSGEADNLIPPVKGRGRQHVKEEDT